MRWLRRVVRVLAVLYPLALLSVVIALRYIGEAWWVTAVALYLPRIAFGAPLPVLVFALWALRLLRLLWLQTLSALLVLFPLMGLVSRWPISTEPNAPVLRLLSYNINSGQGGVDKVVEEIDRYSPDVVLLQEVGNSEDLGRLLRLRYPTVDVSGQFLVATRYPMSSTREPDKIAYDGKMRSPRFLQRVMQTPLGRIVFYDVHPISPREALEAARGHGPVRELLSGRWLSGAAASIVQTNTGLRAQQVEALAEAAASESDPVVIAGDTNLPDLSSLLRRHLSSYQDAFTKASWGLGYTFPATRQPWVRRYPWMRIDRILGSEQLRFVRFDVGQSAASDHFCVVADLQRR